MIKIGGMQQVRVRQARAEDCDRLARMRAALWPDSPVEEHRGELSAIFAGEPVSTLSCVILVAEAEDGSLPGFLEVGLRSHADGCDARRPVGFVEGWYVEEGWRRRGIGGQLLAAVEAWAVEQGCVEIASDTWIDHETSQRAHEALGFEVVDTCVHYRKALPVRDKEE